MHEEQDLDGARLAAVETLLEISNIQTLNGKGRKVIDELIEKIIKSVDREQLPKVMNHYKELRSSYSV